MIVVYGASGRTGRCTVTALRRLGQHITLAGRDPGRLEALAGAVGASIRVAQVDDQRALSALLDGAKVIVNCAGPFATTGLPLARAAIEHGVHYVDVAGEQVYQRELLELDQLAQRAKVTILTGQALELAPAFCGAHVLAECMPGVTRVRTVHYFDEGGPGLSAGSLKSLLNIIASPRVVYESGQLMEATRSARAQPESIEHPLFHDGERREYVSGPFPGADVLLLPRELPGLQDVECRVCLPGAAATLATRLFSLGSSTRLMLKLARPALHKMVRAPEDRVADAPNQHWAVQVTADSSQGVGRCTIVGRDGYASSGAIAALGADWLATGKAGCAGGVVSTAAAFGARKFLDGLADFEIRWDLQTSITACK